MTYNEYEQILSQPRMRRYLLVNGGDRRKALLLYRYNIELSERMFGIINMFEVILRNAIHNHYTSIFNDRDWIVNQCGAGQLLESKKTEIIETKNEYVKSGIYSSDKMVASFTLGFWTTMFTRRKYALGGKKLLRIFPNLPKGYNQKQVYHELTRIREFRNRIAHQEPICYDALKNMNTIYSRRIYRLICNYLVYLSLDPKRVLWIVEKPDVIFNKMDKI